MAFGIYIHIPYCLQRCTYCDFATVSWNHSLPPGDYYQQLIQELKVRRPLVNETVVDTIYFGGGTPSLVGPEFIVSMIGELENNGFRLSPNLEATIEINPATLDRRQLLAYRRGGISRFSVGAQTFNEPLLKLTARKHSVQDTRDTLDLLVQENAHYTMDLLFGLPRQTLRDVQNDLEQISKYNPAHLSAYCLTVPDGHPMALGRAPEDEQVAMYETIESTLHRIGLERYEISNYARAGCESKHNLIYWTDQSYWGLGMSAHSYLKNSRWGTRFWNSSTLPEYARQLNDAQVPQGQTEILRQYQSLTDYCHTSLRLIRGLSLDALRKKYSNQVEELVRVRLGRLEGRGLVQRQADRLFLSASGRLLPNLVFAELTFLETDLTDVDNS